MALQVAIEGGEYVGKSTVCKLLELRGFTVKRQPGNEYMREFIKSQLLSPEKEYPPDVIALAMALDRRLQDIDDAPATGLYITDRSLVSSIIMNTDREVSPVSFVLAINRMAKVPDVVVWLKASDKTIAERARLAGRKGDDRFDARWREVHKMYELEMPLVKDLFPGTAFIEVSVDGKTAEEVADEVHKLLHPYLLLATSGRHKQNVTVTWEAKERIVKTGTLAKAQFDEITLPPLARDLVHRSDEGGDEETGSQEAEPTSFWRRLWRRIDRFVRGEIIVVENDPRRMK